MDYGDTYNGKNVFTDLGFIIQHDRDKLLTLHDRKQINTMDWLERNGSSYHLSTFRTKDAEVSLRCVFAPSVRDENEFWQLHEKLFYQIAQPGWNDLYIADHGKTYKVFYLRMENIDNKTKRLDGVERLFIKFNLVLKVAPEYVHRWERHALLFPEEYYAEQIAGRTLYIHNDPVSLKNKEAATWLLKNRFNVLLPKRLRKPVATGSGVYEKQCDAIVDRKPGEIYNLKKSYNGKSLFRAIRASYKKRPHTIVIYLESDEVQDILTLELELKKALDLFNANIGAPLFERVIIIDKAGSLNIYNSNFNKKEPQD